MHAPFVPYVSPALATGTDTGKLVAAVCFLILAATGRVLVGSPPASAAESELTIVVMDPLAVPLSCACVKGYAQRKYDRLGEYLEQKLHRKVRVSYSEDLARALPVVAGQRVDLIIGKQSVVDSDAARCRLVVRPVARLTDRKGLTTLTGLFVVRTQDPARQLADLKGYTFFFGPADSAEKHSAAVAALRQAGVAVPEPREVCPGCSDAAFKVLEFKDKPGAAGVISCYAMALLEGCGTIDKGSLRVIGQTEPVPFVTAFVTERVPAATRDEIVEALVSARDHAALLEAIESKEGFVRLEAAPSASAAPRSSPSAASPSWPGWRGAGRDGLAAWLPSKFSADTKILWHKPLSGPGLSGIAATGQEVIVADRDADDQCDIFRCLAADNGAQLWELRYPAAGALDYGNSPRATPLIHDGKVYLLGAFGDLHCVNLADGKCLWKKNFIHEFRAKPPKWGLSASPLLVGDKLIVNPGAKDASLAALDRLTGQVLWCSPGQPAAYASFIVGRFGGVEQIVGYDAVSLGGWDVDTGQRLWMLLPPVNGDFNVPTPVAVDGQLLVATENNGTRLYGFDDQGKILSTPLAVNAELAPDTSTPVAVGDRIFGCSGKLFCLNLGDGLKPLWTAEDGAFADFVSIIAAGNRLLVTTADGQLLLVSADGANYDLVSRFRLSDKRNEVLSHPAIVGHRLYVRDRSGIYCVALAST